MTDVYLAQPAVVLAPSRDREVLEMQAFEKGRLQGELEATRRMESEAHLHQKQLLPTQQELQVINLQRPDVVEINHLTLPQRLSWVLGQLSSIAMVVLTIVWVKEYRGDFGWSNAYSGDNTGNAEMFNSFLLILTLGLFCLTQAISNYRFLPINLSPAINRAHYLFMQSAAIVCWCLAMFLVVRSTPEATFWSIADWCFAFAFAVTVSHGIYSMVHTILAPARYRKEAINHGNGSHMNDHIMESPEQARDHSAYNAHGRSVYAPAPVNVHGSTAHTNAANVPNAPANAPRWAENPNTHSEDYWLLPRAKWATVGYFAMGAATLMQFAAVQHVQAAGRDTWSQGAARQPQPLLDPITGAQQVDASGNPLFQATPMSEIGRESILIGCLGLLTLLSVAAISYAAMPPRTTVVKNGVMLDQTRRTSVSHNAETRLGNQIV